jgi:hypothetical protein
MARLPALSEPESGDLVVFRRDWVMEASKMPYSQEFLMH